MKPQKETKTAITASAMFWKNRSHREESGDVEVQSREDFVLPRRVITQLVRNGEVIAVLAKSESQEDTHRLTLTVPITEGGKIDIVGLRKVNSVLQAKMPEYQIMLVHHNKTPILIEDGKYVQTLKKNWEYDFGCTL